MSSDADSGRRHAVFAISTTIFATDVLQNFWENESMNIVQYLAERRPNLGVLRDPYRSTTSYVMQPFSRRRLGNSCTTTINNQSRFLDTDGLERTAIPEGHQNLETLTS